VEQKQISFLKKTISILSIFFFIFSINMFGSLKLPWHKKRAQEDIEYLNSIKGNKDWSRLCNSPVDCSFANTETIKCIIDIRPISSRFVIEIGQNS
jgi:hypothetical protein